MLAGSGFTDRRLSDDEVRQIVSIAADNLKIEGKRLLVIIPDATRTMPMPLMFELLQKEVGPLLREAELALMNLVTEKEAWHLAGEHYLQHPERQAHRWRKEDGYCVVDGQKVPIRRTRLRSQENRKQRLGSYELFQRSAPREHAV